MASIGETILQQGKHSWEIQYLQLGPKIVKTQYKLNSCRLNKDLSSKTQTSFMLFMKEVTLHANILSAFSPNKVASKEPLESLRWTSIRHLSDIDYKKFKQILVNTYYKDFLN